MSQKYYITLYVFSQPPCLAFVLTNEFKNDFNSKNKLCSAGKYCLLTDERLILSDVPIVQEYNREAMVFHELNSFKKYTILDLDR